MSKILQQDLKPKEIKPSIVSQHCVYKFACDLCDADYVLLEAHSEKKILNEDQFRVLKKCHGKFDCLVYEMLLIKELRPSLNTQIDSISAKLFVYLVAYLYVTLFLNELLFFLVFIEYSQCFFFT